MGSPRTSRTDYLERLFFRIAWFIVLFSLPVSYYCKNAQDRLAIITVLAWLSLACMLIALILSIIQFKKYRAKISLALAGCALLITSSLIASYSYFLLYSGIILLAAATIWSLFPQFRYALVSMHRAYDRISRR
jgi:hypothetical protein